ncbi:Uncharacterised protein [uncultured archaeon]|nr:Uncharacterised protein [uncultured archaeon]
MEMKLFYKIISNSTGIHLGVADKLLIRRMIIEKKLDTFDDICVSSREILTYMGYESGILRELNKKVKAYELAFSKYWDERYADSKIKEQDL